MIFKTALCLREWHIFMRQSLEILNLLDIFQKARVRSSVESSSIENATFPYKTTRSKTNVKTHIDGEYKIDLS